MIRPPLVTVRAPMQTTDRHRNGRSKALQALKPPHFPVRSSVSRSLVDPWHLARVFPAVGARIGSSSSPDTGSSPQLPRSRQKPLRLRGSSQDLWASPTLAGQTDSHIPLIRSLGLSASAEPHDQDHPNRQKNLPGGDAGVGGAANTIASSTATPLPARVSYGDVISGPIMILQVSPSSLLALSISDSI